MTPFPDATPRPDDPATALARRELGAAYPAYPEFLPDTVLEAGRYVVRFARSAEDLDAIQRLRFAVFNLELGEGLESAFATGRDHDELDLTFHHLLIASAGSGEVVGTYRLQTAAMAARHGFYSAGEFDLSLLPAAYLDDAVEIGRACVAREHRNGRVLNLLWRGLAHYLAWNGKHQLFGCCSLTSQDPVEGQAAFRWLDDHGHLHRTLCTPPRPGFGCVAADPAAVAAFPVHIPALFRSYLALGAKVMGPPAIDRAFRTIDFLVTLDVRDFDEPTYRFFFR